MVDSFDRQSFNFYQELFSKVDEPIYVSSEVSESFYYSICTLTHGMINFSHSDRCIVVSL